MPVSELSGTSTIQSINPAVTILYRTLSKNCQETINTICQRERARGGRARERERGERERERGREGEKKRERKKERK